MTFQLSRRDVDTAYAYANRNMRRARDPDRGAQGVLNRLLSTGEVLAGAVAVGVASGRFGPLNIANTPVPLDAVGGVAGHLLAFWLDNPASEHIHNVANGVLAGYGTKLGVGIGVNLRDKAGLPPLSTKDITGRDVEYQAFSRAPQYDVIGRDEAFAHDIIGQTTVAPLTEAELAALASQVR